MLCAALLLSGCGQRTPTHRELRGGDDPVIGVEHTDAEMNAAIRKAKDTIDDFIKELAKPKGRHFSVKTPLMTPAGNPEHIWVDVDSYENGLFKGKLGNDPLNLPGKKLGDPVEVKKHDISDWMIMDSTSGELKVTGGYTAEVLMKRENRN
jgi:uncharacterized protein YegJ (DUF2314 family)